MLKAIASDLFMLLNFSLLFLLNISQIAGHEAVVNVSTHDLIIQVGDNATFSAYLDISINTTLKYSFIHKRNNIRIYPDSGEIQTNGAVNRKVLKLMVSAFEPGRDVIQFNVTPSYIDTYDAFIRVLAYKIWSLNFISSVVGWLYFLAWSVSFYPQIYTNWKEKNVIGLNFDYLALSTYGYFAYCIFNVGLYFGSEVQREYFIEDHTGLIPVELNDVVFAVHCVFAVSVQITQCFIYERGGQRISGIVTAIVGLLSLVASVLLIVILLGLHKSNIPWLLYMYYFSYIKLGISTVNSLPQVYYNYKRKSTDGWSVEAVLLDFIGGILSILQMFIVAYNYDDWYSIFGNFPKFGLGLVSMAYDVIFMVQHYCLYGDHGRLEKQEEDRKPLMLSFPKYT